LLHHGEKEAGKILEVQGKATILRFLAGKPVFVSTFSPLLTETLH
jgi:hypothetical protein